MSKKFLDFSTDTPRLTGQFSLAANTVYSLKAFIDAVLLAAYNAGTLFFNEVVANQAARLAVAITSADVGYLVYQTDTTTAYEFTGSDPTVNGDWTARVAANAHPYRKYLSALSGKVKEDSAIGNAGAGDLLLMSRFTTHPSGTAPPSTDIVAHGVPLDAGMEKTYSGHSDQIFLYSVAGTYVNLGLIFDIGA